MSQDGACPATRRRHFGANIAAGLTTLTLSRQGGHNDFPDKSAGMSGFRGRPLAMQIRALERVLCG